ncbi:hypothetical protein [Burkholderia latens]|uniref:hypothetical protein n=1 Tax=Burkholderia latens TaxID=488446 RepID=UPI001ABAC206|nr:hypothetical protein [Burkholderia latens]
MHSAWLSTSLHAKRRMNGVASATDTADGKRVGCTADWAIDEGVCRQCAHNRRLAMRFLPRGAAIFGGRGEIPSLRADSRIRASRFGHTRRFKCTMPVGIAPSS